MGPSEAVHRYSLVVRDQTSRENLIWSQALPAYTSNPAGAGFQLLDIMPVGEQWVLCYKIRKTTFVERIGPSLAPEQPTEISVDRDGFGPPVTQATFSEVDSALLLRLGFRGYKTQAWTNSGNAWSPAPQYEVKIPTWAWPVDLSGSTETNAPYRESFPVADFPEAKWGSTNQGLQLGLILEKAVYHQGEQVFARVCVRNVSSVPLSYEMTTVASKEGPINFLVTDAQSKPLDTENEELAAYVPIIKKELPIGTQNVRGFSLDKQYALKPGSYSICAQVKVPTANDKSVVLASGVANIQIASP
jgi:hypothetical protein